MKHRDCFRDNKGTNDAIKEQMIPERSSCAVLKRVVTLFSYQHFS